MYRYENLDTLPDNHRLEDTIFHPPYINVLEDLFPPNLRRIFHPLHMPKIFQIISNFYTSYPFRFRILPCSMLVKSLPVGVPGKNEKLAVTSGHVM
jgi:hypothetical protein